jgi:hypothetical protein
MHPEPKLIRLSSVLDERPEPVGHGALPGYGSPERNRPGVVADRLEGDLDPVHPRYAHAPERYMDVISMSSRFSVPQLETIRRFIQSGIDMA